MLLTAVLTDAGAGRLAAAENLRKLDANGAKLKDAGIARLAGLSFTLMATKGRPSRTPESGTRPRRPSCGG